MDNIKLFNFSGTLILKDILCYMDGGSALFRLTDSMAKSIEIEFTQTMILEKFDYTNYPGSLLLDKKYVPVRSELERTIINALKQLDISKFTDLDRQIIHDSISFIESEEYIEVAKKVGRIN